MISLIVTGIILFLGCFTILVACLGVMKFNFVMNRMHCAAIIDSIGFFLIVVGLITGSLSMSYIPKLILLLVFQWVSSPIASHMVSRLELETDTNLESHMKKEED